MRPVFVLETPRREQPRRPRSPARPPPRAPRQPDQEWAYTRQPGGARAAGRTGPDIAAQVLKKEVKGNRNQNRKIPINVSVRYVQSAVVSPFRARHTQVPYRTVQYRTVGSALSPTQEADPRLQDGVLGKSIGAGSVVIYSQKQPRNSHKRALGGQPIK